MRHVRTSLCIAALAWSSTALAQDPRDENRQVDPGAAPPPAAEPAPAATSTARPAARGTEIGTSRRFGAGLLVGNPTGLSGKYYLSDPSHAVDFALATTTWGPTSRGAYAHATYLFHPSTLASEPGFTLPWHVGVGGFVGWATFDDWDRWYWNDRYWGDRYDSGSYIGARGVVGLDLNLRAAPVQFFADGAVNLLLAPGVWTDVTVTAGARYYF